MCKLNHEELMSTTGIVEPAVSNGESPDRDTVTEFTLHISKGLHNFVSSTYSVYNYTKTIEKSLLNEDTSSDVESRAKNVFDSPRSNFLKRLRAFMQKYLFPQVKTSYDQTVKYTNRHGNVNMNVCLLRSELQEWDDWNNKAREHVESLDEEIDILSQMEKYYENFRQFNQWFIELVREEYRSEIEQRNEIVRRLKQLASE